MANFFSRGDRESSSDPAYLPNSFNAPRGITASAVPIDMKQKREVEALKDRQNSIEWQTEAWAYYDLIGEIKYASNLIANTVSRTNLYVGYVEDSANVPSKIGSVETVDKQLVKDANDILYALESGNGGTSGFLRSAALNLFIVGEFYLVKEPPRGLNMPPRWQVRSISEVIVTQGNGKSSSVSLKPSMSTKPQDYINLPKANYIARMWKSHPRFSDDADSSLKGLLEQCDELLLLGRAARASAKSRLNAGILFIPDGISASKEADSDDDDIETEIDSIEEELIEALMEPIDDDMSAASVVPTIFRGPEAFGEAIRYITMERPMDAQAAQRAEKLLERVLAGLDIPLDVAKGLSGVKYSNAILIEEQLYKAHIEPMLLMIVDSLSIGFLRPALKVKGWSDEEIDRVVVWYDPSAITAKPSKSEAATTGFGLGIVSGEAWRRYNGFAESDKPTELEAAQRLAESRGALSEALTDALVKTMVPEDILAAVRATQIAEAGPSGGALQEAIGGGPAAGGAQMAPPEDLDGAVGDFLEGEPAPGAPSQGRNPVQGAPEDLIDP